MAGTWPYLRKTLADALRFSGPVRSVAAAALRLRAALERRRPTRRLALLARAAQVCPEGARRQALLSTVGSELERLDTSAIDWEQTGAPARTDLPKGIILKAPVSPDEKGLLHVAFE